MCCSYVKSDVTGKWIIVTGSNTGIGKEVAAQLFDSGANVILACRSLEKGRLACDEISQKKGPSSGSIDVMALDLSSGASIQSFVGKYKADHQQLHILINNAGLNAGGTYSGPKTTQEGADICFGTNYLGHFLLCQLLLPLLIASAPSRIVNLGSAVHWLAKGDFDPLLATPRPGGYGGYSESKLAMVMYANELAAHLIDKHPGIDVRVFSVDPGFVASDIWRDSTTITRMKELLMLTARQGSRTTVEAATQPDLPSGSHLVPFAMPLHADVLGRWVYFLATAVPRLTFGCTVQNPAPLSLDVSKRRQLWDLSADYWDMNGHHISSPPSVNTSFRRRGWSGCYSED